MQGHAQYADTDTGDRVAEIDEADLRAFAAQGRDLLLHVVADAMTSPRGRASVATFCGFTSRLRCDAAGEVFHSTAYDAYTFVALRAR